MIFLIMVIRLKKMEEKLITRKLYKIYSLDHVGIIFQGVLLIILMIRQEPTIYS